MGCLHAGKWTVADDDDDAADEPFVVVVAAAVGHAVAFETARSVLFEPTEALGAAESIEVAIEKRSGTLGSAAVRTAAGTSIWRPARSSRPYS